MIIAVHAVKDSIGAMNMNKQVCYKALNQLQAYASKNGGKFEQEHEILSKLIKQHFDNPPLKFEELEAGMWVWDNKRKEWCVLAAFWKDALNKYYVSGLSDSPFEENRFYRKQVEE